MRVSDFDFYLPEELIAQKPIEPRDASRLMVINRGDGTIEHQHFRDLPQLLRPNDVLVINNTRVLPARLIGEKSGTQAKIELLLLHREEKDVWEVLIKPGKRLKLGQNVEFGQGALKGELIEILPDGNRKVRFHYEGVFEEVLDRLGQMPLPPYISAQLENNERYQTVYAKESGSAAAPTAGLHFTPELMKTLKDKGIKFVEILLHVGLGTFRPVKAEDLSEHIMHSEYFHISEKAAAQINDAKAQGRRIISVGTTVTRTLEAAANEKGQVEAKEGWTDIFIFPGYEFKIIEGMITNFHFPKSTLIMLVSALAGRELILKAYDIAVKEQYRFYSFGDATLIV